VTGLGEIPDCGGLCRGRVHFFFPFCFVFVLIVKMFRVKTKCSFWVALVFRHHKNTGWLGLAWEEAPVSTFLVLRGRTVGYLRSLHVGSP